MYEKLLLAAAVSTAALSWLGDSSHLIFALGSTGDGGFVKKAAVNGGEVASRPKEEELFTNSPPQKKHTHTHAESSL